MDILIIGDVNCINSEFINVFTHEKYKLVIASPDKVSDQQIISGTNRNIRYLSISPTDPNFIHLLSAYHFKAAIYFPYREENLQNNSSDLSAINSVAGLRNVLDLSDTNSELKLFVVSSSEVLPLDGRNAETEEIAPDTINGYALQALENTCLHLNSKYADRITLIRVPYLFNEVTCFGLVGQMLRKLSDGKALELPSKQMNTIQFLHTLDLAEFLLQAIDEPYISEAEIFHLYPSENHNWFEISEWLKQKFSDHEISFSPSVRWHTPGLTGANAKKYYDWTAKRNFNDLKEILFENIKVSDQKKRSLWQRVKDFFSGKGSLVKWVELFLGAALAQTLIYLTSTVILFRQVDYRLLFVVIFGMVHGTTFGLLAALLAIISALVGWSQYGYEWSLLIYNIENWLPFTLYFIAGAVTGYVRDNKDNHIEFLEQQNALLSDKYDFLYGIFDEITEIKDRFREQLMGYRDSFGRIYKITTELDTLQEDEVLYRSLRILEEILNNQSIGIYTIDAAQQFARLQLCSRAYIERLDKSLDIKKLPTLLPHIENGSVFQNYDFIPDHPSIFVPIQQNGQTMAGIAIWKANLDQYSLYYLNLVNVVSGLIRSSLIRSMVFSQANVEKIYLPNSNILRADAFEKVLNVKNEMKVAKIANFELLKVQDNWRSDPLVCENIKKGIRSVDYVGEQEDGSLYILLSQADQKNATFVMERLNKLGVTCQFAN